MTSDRARAQDSLAQVLKVNTRTIHKQLNRLIVRRLPLALPPQAADPSIYLTGLLHVAPIYMTFEALWKSMIAPAGDELGGLQNASSSCPTTSDSHTGPVFPDEFRRPALSKELSLVLSRLFLPGLVRTEALRRDLQRLSGWSPAELDAKIRRLITSDGPLSRFTGHIREEVGKRPHVLIAYAYILYMALFAGGRIIRSSMESQDASFWAKAPISPVWHREAARREESADRDPAADVACGNTPTGADPIPPIYSPPGRTPLPPVSFFRFETPSDEEDLKDEFKRRLLDSESLLDEGEKAEIVLEATVIFEEILAIVYQLDDIFEPSDTIYSPCASNLSASAVSGLDKPNNGPAVAIERMRRVMVFGDGSASPSLSPGADDEELESNDA
jgi:heme oxygenase